MKELVKGTKVILDKIRVNGYTPTGCFMPEEMEEMMGKVCTISRPMYSTSEGSHRYMLKECDYNWTYTDEMFSIYLPKITIGGLL